MYINAIVMIWLTLGGHASPCPPLLSQVHAREFKVSSSSPNSLALAEDGRVLVSFASGELALLNPDDSSRVVVDFKPLQSLRFLDQTNFMYHQDDAIFVFDLKTHLAKPVARGRAHFAVNGQRVVAISADGTELEHTLIGGDTLAIARIADEFLVSGLSRTGRRVAALSSSRRLTIGPTNGSRLRAKPVSENFRVALGEQTPVFLRWIDDYTLMLGLRDRLVWLDANSGEVKRSLNLDGELLETSDHANFAIVRRDLTLQLIDLRHAALVFTIQAETSNARYLEQRKSFWLATTQGSLTQILLR